METSEVSEVTEVQDVEAMRERIGVLEQECAALEFRQRLDSALIAAGPVDLEAARTLAEAAGAGDGDDDTLVAVVSDLRRRRPYLFRDVERGRFGAGGLSPAVDDEGEAADDLERAASAACVSGRRRDLLAYLRLRRRAG